MASLHDDDGPLARFATIGPFPRKAASTEFRIGCRPSPFFPLNFLKEISNGTMQQTSRDMLLCVEKCHGSARQKEFGSQGRRRAAPIDREGWLRPLPPPPFSRWGPVWLGYRRLSASTLAACRQHKLVSRCRCALCSPGSIRRGAWHAPRNANLRCGALAPAPWASQASLEPRRRRRSPSRWQRRSPPRSPVAGSLRVCGRGCFGSWGG